MEKKTKHRSLTVAIVGPESSGKTTLATALSNQFNTSYVPEYARDFLLRTKGHYNEKDLLSIAEGQLDAMIEARSKLEEPIICDTDLLVVHVWGRYKYGRTYSWIEEQLKKHSADLYFLTDIEIPWQSDPFREHPGLSDRQRLFQMYEEELQAHELPYEIVSGTPRERLEFASLKILQYL